jgi:hypothetical protein
MIFTSHDLLASSTLDVTNRYVSGAFRKIDDIDYDQLDLSEWWNKNIRQFQRIYLYILIKSLINFRDTPFYREGITSYRVYISISRSKSKTDYRNVL